MLMCSNMRNQLLNTVVATFVASAIPVTPALAAADNPFFTRIGVGYISPTGESGALTGVPGGMVEAQDATSLAFTIGYMFTPMFGVELLGSLPFTHDIEGSGTLSGAGVVAEAKQLPPTLMAIFSPMPNSRVRPYVGAGVNYTFFFEEEGKGVLTGTDVHLDNSVGPALEAGLDIDVGKRWFINAAVWYMDIDTTATTAVGTAEVAIDPYALTIGVGSRF